MNNVYLLDTNVFITAANNYYAFDLIPSFWSKLEKISKTDAISVIDKVYEEIKKGDDELKNWMLSLWNKKNVLESSESDILNAYSTIINSEILDKYTYSAKINFADCADSWLIAHAYAKKYIIVTLEKFDENIKRRVKIPNICNHFNISCIHLFDFMREIKLII